MVARANKEPKRRVDPEFGIRNIRVDHGLQQRVRTNPEQVKIYADANLGYKDAGSGGFPPVTLYFDGIYFWLADGFHRLAARIAAGFITINAEVVEGTRRDALLYSVSANLTMGVSPTEEDRRKGVESLLADEEFRRYTDSEISRRCGCGPQAVRRYRSDYYRKNGISDSGVRVCSNGVTRRARSRRTGEDLRPSLQGRNVVFNNSGKKIYVCQVGDPRKDEKVEIKRQEIIARTRSVAPIPPGGSVKMKVWFADRGLFLDPRSESPGVSPSLTPDYSAPGMVFRSEPRLTQASFSAALGDVLLWRQAVDPDALAIVICRPNDSVKDMVRVAEGLGVRFMSPEEIAEEFGEGVPVQAKRRKRKAATAQEMTLDF